MITMTINSSTPNLPVHVSVAYVKERLANCDSDSDVAVLISDLVNYAMFEIIFKQNVLDFSKSVNNATP